jgi:hypothetical protein
LDESLGEAAQSYATGTAKRRYCVIIHGLRGNSGFYKVLVYNL